MTKTDKSDSVISKSKLALLPSESAPEFESLRAKLIGEIKPEGVIEEIYVGEVAYFVWETIRLRRIRVGIIQNAIPAALKAILDQLFADPTIDPEQRTMNRMKAQMETRVLSVAWLNDSEAQNKVVERLGKFGFDESAIEAEAFRMFCSDLERVDKMLTMAESRRDRALRFIADYRQDLAQRIRGSVDRLLETDDGLPLLPSDESPATA